MGGAMLHPGTYLVPVDISEQLAERALSEGAAEIVSASGLTTGSVPKAALKKGGGNRKRGPGNNKSLWRAPENKSQVG